ncbi:MAG: hypothetical protein SH850_13715 [Planctomycetaceae bacterium]|nr:hypothetical protein [Planctomycetaceae bacterium]
MTSRHAVRHLAVAVLNLCTIGCGGVDYGPTGKITGRLTMDGKPLAAGTAVSFMQMEKGFLAFGMTDADGKFEVDSFNSGDMPAGVYKVMIAPPAAPAPKDVSAEEAFENPELRDPTVKVEFPKKYRDTNTSGLEYEVKAGANDFPIDLTAK